MPNACSTKPNALRPRSGLNSGLDVLDCVAASERPLHLKEIAARVGMAKSSVSALLATLRSRGLLRRLDDQRYVVGLGTWDIASRSAPMEFGRLAHPLMASLSRELVEGVALGMLEFDHTVCVCLVESPNSVRVHSRIGDRTPLHCASSGLAILASMSDEAVLQMLPEELEQVTPFTLATSGQVLSELAAIRSRGYAISRKSWRAEVGGVSIALHDSSGYAVTALNVALPISRLTEEWLERAIPLMRVTARAIARKFVRQDESPERASFDS